MPPLPICRNIFCICSKACMLAGSHIFMASSGLMARLAAMIFSCISCISASCIGLTSGRPRKARASSGVQSISKWIFI